MLFANFHTHTSFSDGAIDPEGLVMKVSREPDLKFFALTDHDTLSGIEPIFRSLKKHEHLDQTNKIRFVPGIELSLKEEKTGIGVHLAGLFPDINQSNYKESLKRIDAHLGDFCRHRSAARGQRDCDGRIKRAFDKNLDGIADRFQTAEEVIAILRSRAESKNRALFRQGEKEHDVIQHPIPYTYQTIIDHWEDLVPNSTREIVTLYILRPAEGRAKKLSEIYESQGLNEAEAAKLAKTNQGTLCRILDPPPSEKGMFEGLNLLKRSEAVSILVHPAIDHERLAYEDYDRNVLFPLIDQGLDGIEVYYPYDLSYREEAITHYFKIARKQGLLISGGTDYHGDDRIGLSDVKLDEEEALKIIHHKYKA